MEKSQIVERYSHVNNTSYSAHTKVFLSAGAENETDVVDVDENCYTALVSMVRIALIWLIQNNPLYFVVEISDDNLQSLPEDGNVYDNVQSFQDIEENSTDILVPPSEEHNSSNQSSEDMENESILEEEVEEDIGTIYETGVPMLGKPSEKSQLESILDWPTIDASPVNEFRTVGYIAQAFPKLFPWGLADLNSPREKKVTPINYFKHLMKYHDDRFAKHPRFRFFALNSTMRWSALKDGNLFIKFHPEFKDMKAQDLKEQLAHDPNSMKKMMFHSSNIKGTRASWYARGKELMAMIEQLLLPTFFFTLSAADFHWPDLYKL
ncbi:hypothetical protein FOCC_FOCC002087 [Frankliniella occidentalis]|nr:hypothetical protein FOCC_FOCC002087 [Frankliniella occidentalis]